MADFAKNKNELYECTHCGAESADPIEIVPCPVCGEDCCSGCGPKTASVPEAPNMCNACLLKEANKIRAAALTG